MDREYQKLRTSVVELEFLVNLAKHTSDREIFKRIKNKLKEIQSYSKKFKQALFLTETGFYEMIGKKPPNNL